MRSAGDLAIANRICQRAEKLLGSYRSHPYHAPQNSVRHAAAAGVRQMRLIQYLDEQGQRRVGAVSSSGATVRMVEGFDSTYALASAALERGLPLGMLAESAMCRRAPLPYADLLAGQRVLSPLTHPDPAHCLVSGTGLTHLGSAATRDAMHQKATADEATLSDSMRMFKSGLEGGKPAAGEAGAQPEWFYKGNGHIVAAPGAPLASPGFALDAGEEPELVGL